MNWLNKIFDYFESLPSGAKCAIIAGGASLVCYAGKKAISHHCDMKKAKQQHIYKMEEITLTKQKVEAKKENVRPVYTVPVVDGLNMQEIAHSSIRGESEDYLVGKLIRVGDHAILYGPTNVGKSYLCFHIANAISKGLPSGLFDPSLDNEVHDPQKVFMYTAEMTMSNVKSQFSEVDTPNLVVIDRAGCSTLTSSKSGLIKNIAHQLESQRIDCTVILDNLTKLCESTNYNIRKFYLDLDRIQKQVLQNGVRVTFICVMHANKESSSPGLDQIQGVGDIVNLSQNIIGIYPVKKSKQVFLNPTKSKNSDFDSEDAFFLSFSEKGGGCYYDYEGKGTVSHQKVIDEELRQMIKLKKDGKTQVQIANIMNVSQAKVSQRLSGVKIAEA